MSMSMPYVLLDLILCFFSLISLLKLDEILSRQSSSSFYSTTPSMSTAERELVIVLPPMLTVLWVIFQCVRHNSLRKDDGESKQKRVGESREPCLTRTVVLKQSSMPLTALAALVT